MNLHIIPFMTIDPTVDYYSIINARAYFDQEEVKARASITSIQFIQGIRKYTLPQIDQAGRILKDSITREEYDCLRSGKNYTEFTAAKAGLKIRHGFEEKEVRIKKQKDLVDLYNQNGIFFQIREMHTSQEVERDARIYAATVLVDIFEKNEDAAALLKLKRTSDRALLRLDEVEVYEKIIKIATKKLDVGILDQLTYEKNEPAVVEQALIVLRRFSTTLGDTELKTKCEEFVKSAEERLDIGEDAPKTIFVSPNFKGKLPEFTRPENKKKKICA